MPAADLPHFPQIETSKDPACAFDRSTRTLLDDLPPMPSPKFSTRHVRTLSVVTIVLVALTPIFASAQDAGNATNAKAPQTKGITLADVFDPKFLVKGAQPPFTLRSVLRDLASHQTLERSFTETRAFAISKNPIQTRGILRYSRSAGVSMAYEPTAAEAQSQSEESGNNKPSNVGKLIIIDDRGLLEKFPNGKERAIFVADHPELGAMTDVFLNLLRGDSSKLLATNEAYFIPSGQSWVFGLEPKDPDLVKKIGRVVIFGHHHTIVRIQTINSRGEVRTVNLGPARVDVNFDPNVLAQFFRPTQS